MSNRLYVGNLAFHTTADAVRQAFSAFGEITDIHLVLDRESGRSRGFAFVTLATAEAAARARVNMHGAPLDGRALRVGEAAERPVGARSGGRVRGASHVAK
jgi:RNA recognition motif-containing protein